MCGLVAVILSSKKSRAEMISKVNSSLDRIQHRGPDGRDFWLSDDCRVGLGHVRLAVLDLELGAQPMTLNDGTTIVFNGEIYNYIELRKELGLSLFKTKSDTEVVLRAFQEWGEDCVNHLRGMFSFVIYNPSNKKTFFARDRFGIKPLYSFQDHEKNIYIASEIKALLPFIKSKNINSQALSDYFSFQFTIGSDTLLENIEQVMPAHSGWIDSRNMVSQKKYWDVHYKYDFEKTETYFIDKIKNYIEESTCIHMISDVEVGSYASGGIDSSLISKIGNDNRADKNLPFKIFNGRFDEGAKYDESMYAKDLANENNMDLHITNITESDFVDSISKVIYHLDTPVAGPGAFPQYMVSKDASKKVKVVLGGQGGDEIFGGYSRYLIAYFEKCIQGAIEGTLDDGNFIVSYESIIPNLNSLNSYKPLIKEFMSEGLFEQSNKRYFRLINRANTIQSLLESDVIDTENSFKRFDDIFSSKNVGKESYFDQMTHFDFKTLLPSLLQVEDRMSMAHGLESRVPFLDHQLIELTAKIPANIKFKNGELKRILKKSFSSEIPKSILKRKDKMGFPTPINEWIRRGGPMREYVGDIFSSQKAKTRPYLNKEFSIDKLMNADSLYGRNLWALLSLELWQNHYIDV